MNRYSGFSLVEVVISGALVATTVGALFAASSMAVRLTVSAQDRLTASQLAREGIEIVRQIRDNNFVATTCPVGQTQCHQSWTDGILSGTEALPLPSPVAKQVISPGTAGASFSLATVNDTNAKCGDYLVRDTKPGGGGITQVASFTDAQGANKELFCRRILIETVPSMKNDAIRVRSQVAWLANSKTSLRTLADVKNSPACPGVGTAAVATEWCSEQVTILTNWRHQ